MYTFRDIVLSFTEIAKINTHEIIMSRTLLIIKVTPHSDYNYDIYITKHKTSFDNYTIISNTEEVNV